MQTIIKRISNVTFELLTDHEFPWLTTYDEVFAVFDQQDSGNLCFGVRKGVRRLFIKYAGAETLNYLGDGVGGVQGAIDRLRDSARAFDDLRHPSLVSLVWHGEVGEGYALIFDWIDGESLHAHSTYDLYPKYTHPLSAYKRFKDLPVEKRLLALNDIYSFHASVAHKGYVAVDFYDGSLVYDFKRDRIIICDIDFYHKGAFINEMGRLWGSSRFMSPEEFEKGALIDELTNVYTMGATAFELLCGQKERGWVNWQATDAIRSVAERATQKERAARYPTIAAFCEAWDRAVQADYPGLNYRER